MSWYFISFSFRFIKILTSFVRSVGGILSVVVPTFRIYLISPRCRRMSTILSELETVDEILLFHVTLVNPLGPSPRIHTWMSNDIIYDVRYNLFVFVCEFSSLLPYFIHTITFTRWDDHLFRSGWVSSKEWLSPVRRSTSSGSPVLTRKKKYSSPEWSTTLDYYTKVV